MGADFEAELRNSLRGLTSEVAKLAKSMENAKTSARGVGDEAAKSMPGWNPAPLLSGSFRRPNGEASGAPGIGNWRSMGKARREAREATKEADKLRRGFAQVGLALGRFGGPLGTIATHVGGAQGLSPGLGRLAIAAGVAGVAWMALNKVVDANIARVQVALDVQDKFRASAQSFRDMVRASADAGFSREKMTRNLDTGGIGPQGSNIQANNEAATGIAGAAGITRDEASGTVAELRNRFGGNAARFTNATERIKDLVASGMPLAEATEMTLHSGGLNSTPKTPEEMAAFRQTTARLYARGTGARGQTTDQVRASMDATQEANGMQSLLDAGAEHRGTQDETSKANAYNAASGGARAGDRKDLAAARDPASAASLELFNSLAVEQNRIAQLSEAQGKLLGFISDLVKPEGSFSTQLSRLTMAIEKQTLSRGGG